MRHAGAPAHSALYEGRVSHCRFGEVRHQFSMPVTLCYFDLTELDLVLSQHPLWSAGRWRPVQLRRGDYGGDPSRPIDEGLRQEAETASGEVLGPVRLLAHPRTWGHCFNPLSLGFCFDRTGERVCAVVATVTNTPWGERCDYVLPAAPDGSVEATVEKALHVSPFLPMDLTYHFAITPPGERLSVSVEVEREGHRALRADLALRRRPLDRSAMTGLLLRHPPMTWRVSAGIYHQAGRLAAKGAAFHRHPAKGAAFHRHPAKGAPVQDRAP